MDTSSSSVPVASSHAQQAAASFRQDPVARIRRARRVIAPFVRRTPVLTSPALDELAGASLFFKCENLQIGGAFKARGAHHAIHSLPEELVARGVVTHSSGNHGAAVAIAARTRGLPAHVVMPHTAPRAKIAAVRRYGGIITQCEPTLAAREAAVRDIIAQTGATLIHPYDDYDIIAGQGTAAAELIDEVQDLHAIVTPVGGGGLLSGTAVYAKSVDAKISVYGVEPEAADDAARSLETGVRQPPTNASTIADGLRVALSERTFDLIRAHTDGIVTVSESQIIAATRLAWEELKIVIEPSSAVSLAAILHDKLALKGRRVGIILTGGNVDLDVLPWQRP